MPSMPRRKGTGRKKGPRKPAPVDRVGPGAMKRARTRFDRDAIRQRRKEMLRSGQTSKRGMES